MSRWIVRTFAIAALIALPARAQTYELIDLTALGLHNARSINDAGQVAGLGPGVALIYSNGVATNIGTLPGTDVQDVSAISASGDVTGTVIARGTTPNAYGAFLYSNGQMAGVGSLPGLVSNHGYGVNATGQVTGSADFDYVLPDGKIVLFSHAFLYGGGTTVDLGLPPGANADPSVSPVGSYGQAINTSGQIAGYALAGGNTFPFRYSGGVFQGIGLTGFGGGNAFSINDSGLVTGYASTSDGFFHAFISDGITTTDINNAAYSDSYGFGINASGMVTGWFIGAGAQHAFLYENGAMVDLNSLIDPNDPLQPYVTLTKGSAINATGSIVADGLDSRDPVGSAPRVYMVVPAGTAVPPSLSANATTITVGTPVVLTWSGRTGTACTATGGGAGDGWTGSLPVSGSKTVTESAAGQYTYVVSCTGTNGAAQAKLTVTNILPTVTLSANATAVFPGNPVMLTWTESPGISCTATGGNSSDGWAGSVAGNGAKSVTESAAGHYAYGLMCASGGFTAQAQVNVSVAGPAVTLTSDAATVLVGKPFILTWNATQGSACSATGGVSADGWTGSLPVSGSRTVSESTVGTYTYGVTCTGGTQTGQAQVTVAVVLPSVSLAAAPSTVSLSQAVVLTWSSIGPTACTASGGGNGDGWVGNKAASGTLSVTESAVGTYTFSLTCAYGTQSLQAVAVVTVNAPSPTVSLSAAPSTITVGQAAVLTWASTFATACTASGGGNGDGWAGAKGTSGTESVTEASAATYTFTLVCSAGGPSAQAQAAVTVNAPPKSGGGGGALDGWALLALSTIFGLRSGAWFWRVRGASNDLKMPLNGGVPIR